VTTATKRRKLDKVESLVEGRWLNAWLDWAKAALTRWGVVDSRSRSRHHDLFLPLYQEWGEAAFLSRGASLAKWWAGAPALWAWLWEVQRGWLEQDLRKWPNQLPEPPAVPAGALERVVAGMETAEDCALALAICSALVRRGA
jgi:hypothetical protein